MAQYSTLNPWSEHELQSTPGLRVRSHLQLRFLPDCIGSVLQQTFSDWELVIIRWLHPLGPAGVAQCVEFLFREPVSLIRGELELDRMAKGLGCGENSSFLIRPSAYRKVDGYDLNLLYPGECDRAARLCQIGDDLHTDEVLLSGREHPEASSSVDPWILPDAQDWLATPAKVFPPRPVMWKNWRRYQGSTSLLTVRYLITVIAQRLSGRRTCARGLAEQMRHHGNVRFGLAYSALHATGRSYQRIRGKKRFLTAPPEPWIGIPLRAQSRRCAQIPDA